MALTSSSSSNLQLPIRAILVLVLLLLTAQPSIACYTHLFSFGDSLTDTGNFAHSIGKTPDHVRRLPYGSTYFGHPTGRFCDGRLIVDFLAEAFGLPFGTPYLAAKSVKDFRHGANFAVGGATALSLNFFREKGMMATWTEYSLGTQIQWFKRVLSLLSNESDCSNIMSSSLFIVGEIGGNDYNHQFLQGRNLASVRQFVPSVVDAISSAINELIELGAKTLVVPGNFPIGCVPVYLTIFQSQREEDYDPKTGCIKWLNEFSEYHNQQLQDELDRLRVLHPHVTIIYADYFGASMNIFRSPHQYGFTVPLNACCGSDGPYNCTPSISCGSPESRVCADPSAYASWDGLHLTEAAYKLVAHGVLRGPYAVPALANTCPHIELNAAPLLYSNQCSG
ncbi:GDSL esterase/lipase At1g28570-like [Typha angustifolia]|uniref:GDSL esterase/lipase At1g28570-like n=1 Tax=Typha angustifolia TaxID=59011 RepID=UPI003C2E6136